METQPARCRRGTYSDLWKAIGPGVLVCGAAVGGSHLVWSTRAGAEYGWSLLGLLLLANLLKYPFFLYGQRYTAATGESLLAGYLRHGRGYLIVFLLINILTGMINIAGVSMLTGALLAGYGISLPVPWLTVFVITGCSAIILFGHYRLLDGLSKWVMLALTLLTFAALAIAWAGGPRTDPGFVSPSPWDAASFAFLIGLLGWMPAPVDLSAWASLWMFSRKRQTGHMATVRESSVDFHLGYIGAVVLAVAFLALGVLVMHGTGAKFSASGAGFSNQFVSLYASAIGDWSRPIILTAAFFTMFSTSITCIDGYPRSLAACCSLLRRKDDESFESIHRIWILLSAAVSSIIVLHFVSSLMQLLTFAAVVSFLTSPILAWINYQVMSGNNVPAEHRPGPWLRWISRIGIAFFVLMSLGYVVSEFAMKK
jgi:Mn2+/Fe2+ NRAMP family transporter